MRVLSFLALLSTAARAQEGPPQVVIRAGEKTHGPGEHDHPRFLSEWSALLRARGCEVRGSEAFPSAKDLAWADVLVCYAAEGASIFGAERERLQAYLDSGGGLVFLHDAVCGEDPHWFKTIAGGAWEHGHSKWSEGKVGLYFADSDHPITHGISNFDIEDEIYYELHMDPGAQVLAHGFHTPFDITPQTWIFEKRDYRAFVSLQGHQHRSFSHPAWRALLLRGIAWASRRDADLLLRPEELAALRYPEGGPRPPGVAAESFELHPGFEVGLVAAEPDVVNPISIDWDARGRAWVALTPGYPDKQEFSGVSARDQIVILEDSDGDARTERRAVFAAGLDLVTSLVLHRDGVIVTQAPDILWLRDTDGDDRVDERVTLFSGFGYGDTHAVLSNLRWGLDGWIYGTQGYSGNASRNIVGADGTDHGHVPNGLFRFLPDGSRIETVSAYGSNTWGCDFTWDGELFFTMANGSHLRHVVMSDAALRSGRIGGVQSWFDVTDHTQVHPILAYERENYLQIDFVGGFTAAAGSAIYAADAWPPEFHGDHFVCEPTVNVVHRDVLERDGVTFRATRARPQEFLASSDLWFRPVHLRVGPDGALFVLDFYNQAAVHNDTRGPEHGPTNAAVRPDRDDRHGRIWRVSAKGAEHEFAALELESEGLVRELLHGNRWRRMTAQRLLVEAQLDGDTIARLEELARGAPVPWGRIHALWVLAQSGSLGAVTLTQALADESPEVRRNALTIAGSLYTELSNVAYEAAEEDDPRTRLAAWIALGGGDRSLREAVRIYPELVDDWSRSAVLGLAVERPAVFLETVLTNSERPDAFLELVERLLQGTRADDHELAAQILLCVSRSGWRAPALGAVALRGLHRERASSGPPFSPGLRDGLLELLRSDEIELAIAALPIARVWAEGSIGPSELAEVAGRLRGIVEDPEAELGLRLACLETWLTVPDSRADALDGARRFLDPYFPPDAQLEVLERLFALEDARAADVIVERYTQLSHEARQSATEGLLQRPALARLLLDALEEERIAARELGPSTQHRLRNHADPSVAERALHLLQGQSATAEIETLLAELLPVVEQPGDPARGRELFDQNCANCHRFDGEGGNVGPELAGIGAHGARTLLPIILDPNRAVEAAYLEYVCETVDGRLIDGVIVRDGKDAVVLRNATGENAVPRDEIASLTSTGRSPMPTGFQDLGAEGLRDLLAYLAGDYGDYRVLGLSPFTTASSSLGMYDRDRDAHSMRFQRHGIVDVGGVPFELLDPAVRDGSRNVVVLKGGMVDDWESKLSMPQRIEIPVGFAMKRLHVLGGIAAWGYPFTQSREPICRLVWNYDDGAREERILVDGTEFADWIRRHDVPGSEFVDLLAAGSPGQVRRFHVDPDRPGVTVASIVLESFDNHLAPTFVALTAQMSEPDPEPAGPAVDPEVFEPVDVFVFGGGSSHDFSRWFAGTDVDALRAAGRSVAYGESEVELRARLAHIEVLVLCNNQPLADEGTRAAVFAFVERGGGLLLLHAATWYNWADWPDFNTELVGGGARSHEDYGAFEVRCIGEGAFFAGVPRSFTITDELYRAELLSAVGSEVLVKGKSLKTGEAYPVAWRHDHGEGKVLALTLGHDGAAHEHAAFGSLMANAIDWLSVR